MYRLAWLPCFLFAAVAAAQDASSPTPGSIAGRVTNEAGMPIAGVGVRALSQNLLRFPNGLSVEGIFRRGCWPTITTSTYHSTTRVLTRWRKPPR